MKYRRMPIEIESPEQMGYDTIKYNLTESSCADLAMSELDLDLQGLLVAYCDHRGKVELRDLIARDSGLASRDEVLMTPGAAGALFIIATTLLGPDDHLLVVRPNYATNLETPRAIGCHVDIYDLKFEEGFDIDLARLTAMLHPRTKYLSVTIPSNPTGVVWSEARLRQLIALAEDRGIKLLVDETYREMTFAGPLPVAASLSPAAISVSSLSKTYGLPGLRMGWIATKDPALQEKFLAAKEQIVICNSVVDEEISWQFLRRKAVLLPGIRREIAERFALVRQWYGAQDELEWIEPQGGVVAFPRIKPGLRVDVDRFYRVLQEQHGTFVGPGHWFEMDRRFMRIGFGWPKREHLVAGLQAISAAVRSART
ncbi:MAG: pyridoxal phosphate-dependent aminotransferase [Verrucomicrobia bacterium]|nr:pyridoxal phosphate-dependent aminotransferase [Verrucomicrobiota bacterium]